MARSKELEEKIIKLYNSGLSMAKVGKEVGRTSAVVCAVLKKYNIQARTNGGIYALPTQEIIHKYVEEKRTLESIGKDYNVSINTIKKVLLDNNIQIRTSSESKNPYFIKNYFNKIDTEAKAYYLGFLITDGYVLEPDNENNHPNYRICLELQSNDEYILEDLKQELQLTSPSIYRQERIKNNTISKTSSLNWYSTEMAQDLAKYGVLPRKTKTVFLPQLTDDMMSHLIRGMIDGDGCITITHPRGTPRLAISFCGNEQCVTQVRDFLVRTLKVFKVIVHQAGENLYQISWAGREDCLKICEYLYKDANFFLTRKHDIYKLALNNFNDENTEVI